MALGFHKWPLRAALPLSQMSLSGISFVIIAVAAAIVVAVISNVLFNRYCPRRRPNDTSQGYPLGDVERSGSWSSSISSFIPSFQYSGEAELRTKDKTCSVCLAEFKEGEDVRFLPRCLHTFHVACIDMWLYSHPTARCVAPIQASLPLSATDYKQIRVEPWSPLHSAQATDSDPNCPVYRWHPHPRASN